MFGSFGSAIGKASMVFVSQASVAHVQQHYGLQKQVVGVRGCRSVKKKDMALNDYLPNIEVDPETYKVTVDGVHLTCEPATKLPLAQLYNLF
jgi:urease subunit alpha